MIGAFMIATERATEAEKAEAWNRVMASTGSDADALMAAWEWLDGTVRKREEAEKP
jgi:hypothetical protein